MTEDDPQIPPGLSGTTLDLYKRWLACEDRVAGFAAPDPLAERGEREPWTEQKRADYRRAVEELGRAADELYDATEGTWPAGHLRGER
jgi:hypothetical protein